MSDERPRDVFDKVIGLIDGTPDTRKTRPTTMVSVEAMLGDAQTYIVQTYQYQGEMYGFVQMIDRHTGSRFVLPPKVMNAIYRQRDALIKAGRKSRGKERWANMSEEERDQKVSHLRKRSA